MCGRHLLRPLPVIFFGSVTCAVADVASNNRTANHLCEDQVALLQTSLWTSSRTPSNQRRSLLQSYGKLYQKDIHESKRIHITFAEWKKSSLFARLDPASKQLRVFMEMGAVLAVTGIFFAFVANLDEGQSRFPAYLLAATSAFAFGSDNFLSGYAGNYLHSPSAHMGMVFIMDGIIAVVLHFIFQYGYPDYQKACEETLGSGRALIFTFLTAFFIVAAMLCGNIGFNIDPSNSGPHQALVCGDTLIVGPFFYFIYGEEMSKVQLLGCAFIISGMLVMSNCFASPKERESEAFLWLAASMVGYASSIITWRLISTGDEQAPWQPRLLLIFGFMGILGAVCFPAYLEGGLLGPYMETPALLLWPILDSIASFIGMCAVNLAYEKIDASTGAITAVVDANSIVLLMLNMFFLNVVPSTIEVVGMTVVLFGVLIICADDL